MSVKKEASPDLHYMYLKWVYNMQLFDDVQNAMNVESGHYKVTPHRL